MKKYLIAETTREEREKIVEDSIALSTLDCAPPSEYAMKLNQQYIDGKIEISEIKNKLLEHYGIGCK